MSFVGRKIGAQTQSLNSESSRPIISNFQLNFIIRLLGNTRYQQEELRKNWHLKIH